MKKHFFIKLIPPRASFSQDMSDAERKIMQDHIVYWRGFMGQGKVVVFGPVLDPKGAYGMGVVQMDSEEEVNTFMAADPSVTGSLNTYEVYGIMAVVPQGS